MSTTPNEKTDNFEAPLFDPFPVPNTIPSGWHIAGLVPDPAPAPVTKADSTSKAEGK